MFSLEQNQTMLNSIYIFIRIHTWSLAIVDIYVRCIITLNPSYFNYMVFLHILWLIVLTVLALIIFGVLFSIFPRNVWFWYIRFLLGDMWACYLFISCIVVILQDTCMSCFNSFSLGLCVSWVDFLFKGHPYNITNKLSFQYQHP